MTTPPLTKPRTRQQTVDKFLDGVRRLVIDETVNVFRLRREADEVEVRAAGERDFVGLGRGSDAVGFEAGEDEAVALVKERLGIEPFDLMDDAVKAAVAAANGRSAA